MLKRKKKKKRKEKEAIKVLINDGQELLSHCLLVHNSVDTLCQVHFVYVTHLSRLLCVRNTPLGTHSLEPPMTHYATIHPNPVNNPIVTPLPVNE